MSLLDWTSDHVTDSLVIVGMCVYAIWFIRSWMEWSRYLSWFSNPNNEWRQMMYGAYCTGDPTICKCRCVDHGFVGGGMHFMACCEPCQICKAPIAQAEFPQTGYRHEEHRRLAHPSSDSITALNAS